MFYGMIQHKKAISCHRSRKYITLGQGENTMQLNNERIQQTNTIISSLRPGFYGDDPLTTVRLPHRGLSSQSLGK